MYIMQAPIGMIISPAMDNARSHWKNVGSLNGYGGDVLIYYVRVPSADDYHIFSKEMKNEEWLLRSRLLWK